MDIRARLEEEIKGLTDEQLDQRIRDARERRRARKTEGRTQKAKPAPKSAAAITDFLSSIVGDESDDND